MNVEELEIGKLNLHNNDMLVFKVPTYYTNGELNEICMQLGRAFEHCDTKGITVLVMYNDIGIEIIRKEYDS